MLPEFSAVIRVNSIRLEGCIDEALQREVSHVLSGQSDHETGSTEPPSDSPRVPAPPLLGIDASTEQPSGKKAAYKRRRKMKRALRRANCPSLPRFSNSKKHSNDNSIAVDFNVADLPAAKGAFVSQRQRCNRSHEWTLEELVNRGFKVVEWNGRYVLFYSVISHAHRIFLRTPTVIVDQEDRIMTILAGRPQGQDWDQVHAGMSSLLEQARSNVQGFHKERRGKFVSLSTGVSYGGGQKVGLPSVPDRTSHILLSHAPRYPVTSLTAQITWPSSMTCARTPNLYALPGL